MECVVKHQGTMAAASSGLGVAVCQVNRSLVLVNWILVGAAKLTALYGRKKEGKD
jgi:hypothetical protein